jgi:hypothetical protein
MKDAASRHSPSSDVQGNEPSGLRLEHDQLTRIDTAFEVVKTTDEAGSPMAAWKLT